MRRTAEIDSFGEWLVKLLSLDGNKATDRLETVLDEIPNCSLNIEKLKAAFLMYVSGKFPLEPRDNYLTLIQFNKVVNYYIQEENKKNKLIEVKREPMKAKEILYYNKLAVRNSYNYFELHREVDPTRIYVYEILFALGKIPNFDDKNIKEDAKIICEREQSELEHKNIQEKRNFAQVLNEIQEGTSVKIIIKCKELVLAKFYRDLKEEKLTEFKKDFEINSQHTNS